jgi:hypothetical protein
MSIATLIASNLSSFVSVVKQFTSNPKINGLPIQAVRFDCVMEAEVSRHVLINLQQNLENVFDNVAPGPRTWEIEGYVGGLPIELSSLYMPSLKFFVDLLDGVFNSRTPCNLIDPSFRSYSVLISRFKHSTTPGVQNKVAVSMSLVEVTVLKASVGPLATVPDLQSAASATPGLPNAAPAVLGATANTAAAGAPNLLTTLLVPLVGAP